VYEISPLGKRECSPSGLAEGARAMKDLAFWGIG